MSGMQEDIIIRISQKIKEQRKAKGITVQELANKAEVSKGLISQIENCRTVPSLLVLVNIIRALNQDMNEFFNDIDQHQQASRIIVVRQDRYQPIKENAKGYRYQRVISRTVKGCPMDVMLADLKKGARRSQMVKADAWEYQYVIKGTVEYQVHNEVHVLEAGDSIFFDGRLGHKPSNIGDDDARMLLISFFEEAS
ncbi:transcriptional regulator [Chitinophaga cymbidii]|uniref:Transcriptional regulator n=2 Tax=Chitinophaga cymbidii TaxID=1096750 RepID=A0A512RGC7_9BACT|nr:transcriptional regulator [Chitinophaga cymbidii]